MNDSLTKEGYPGGGPHKESMRLGPAALPGLNGGDSSRYREYQV